MHILDRVSALRHLKVNQVSDQLVIQTGTSVLAHVSMLHVACEKLRHRTDIQAENNALIHD